MENSILNKIVRNIAAICFSFLIMISSFAVTVSADEPVVTYGVEYGENSATVTIYLSVIDAFDIGIVYDSSKITVSDCGYSMDFKKLQVGGENTTISVLNEDAKDDAGNTYMIFTGAGANLTTNDSIEFAGKPLCYVTFEGDLEGSEITVVTDTATADNVYDADLVGKLTFDMGTKAEVTPEPIENVVYEKIEDNSEDTSTKSDSDENVTEGNSETSDTSSVDSSVSSGETDALNDSVSTESPDTEAGDETETPEDKKDASVADEKAKSENDGFSKAIVAVVIVLVLAIAAVVIAIVIRKKKK